MTYPRRTPTVRQSLANIEASPGPELPEYALPLDRPRLYKWVPGDASVVDHYAVLQGQGGTDGRWLLVREPLRGADLGNADATVKVGGKFLRVLPAATLTGNHSVTFSTESAALGDIIRVLKLDKTAFTYALINGGAGAGTITTLPAAQAWWFDVYFDGTNWIPLGAGQLP